jgi:hypothetical protein
MAKRVSGFQSESGAFFATEAEALLQDHREKLQGVLANPMRFEEVCIEHLYLIAPFVGLLTQVFPDEMVRRETIPNMDDDVDIDTEEDEATGQVVQLLERLSVQFGGAIGKKFSDVAEMLDNGVDRDEGRQSETDELEELETKVAAPTKLKARRRKAGVSVGS